MSLRGNSRVAPPGVFPQRSHQPQGAPYGWPLNQHDHSQHFTPTRQSGRGHSNMSRGQYHPRREEFFEPFPDQQPVARLADGEEDGGWSVDEDGLETSQEPVSEKLPYPVKQAAHSPSSAMFRAATAAVSNNAREVHKARCTAPSIFMPLSGKLSPACTDMIAEPHPGSGATTTSTQVQNADHTRDVPALEERDLESTVLIDEPDPKYTSEMGTLRVMNPSVDISSTQVSPPSTARVTTSLGPSSKPKRITDIHNTHAATTGHQPTLPIDQSPMLTVDGALAAPIPAPIESQSDTGIPMKGTMPIFVPLTHENRNPLFMQRRIYESDMRDPKRLAPPKTRQLGTQLSSNDDPLQSPLEQHRGDPSEHSSKGAISDKTSCAPSPAKKLSEAALYIAGRGEGQAWDKIGDLAEWASGVPLAPPSEPEVSPPSNPDSSSIILPDRPISTRPIVPAAIVYYSEDEDSGRPTVESIRPIEVTNVVEQAVHYGTKDALPPHPYSPQALPNAGDPGLPVSSVPPSDHSYRQPRPMGIARRSNGPKANAVKLPSGQDNPNRRFPFWKRPPHPSFHPHFAARRLLIEFPFLIRTDQARQAMMDHFARYGTVWRIMPYQTSGDSCDKVILVFEDASSVHHCLADPNREECQYRSSNQFAQSTAFELKIKYLRPEAMTRTVWISVTGPRADERARSASPRRQHCDAINESDPDALGHDRAALPEEVVVYAVPTWSWNGQRIVHWAKILPPGVTEQNVIARAQAETGRAPVFLARVDLRRRCAQKDFVPTLCDLLSEIIDIYPPTHHSQGWLVTVGGPQEGRHTMEELSNIPGITTRWAAEGDGVWHGWPTPSTTIAELSAGHTPNPTGARDSSPPCAPNDGGSIYSGKEASEIVQPPVAGTPPTMKATRTEGISGHSPIMPITPDIQYPNLRKVFLHTYKGRKLEEDTSSLETRYVDKAAVFVGRLVQSQETKETLFKRFARYGKIVEVEYNPHKISSTYATARILYQIPEAAQRAIHYEAGQVSFGSGIKVEERKVLPLDVHTREMFIDIMGRPVSPSMASQYSLPSTVNDHGWEHCPPPPNPVPLPGPLHPVFGPIPVPPSPPWPMGQPVPLPTSMFFPPPMPQGVPSPPFTFGLPIQYLPQPSGLIPALYAMGIGYYQQAGTAYPFHAGPLYPMPLGSLPLSPPADLPQPVHGELLTGFAPSPPKLDDLSLSQASIASVDLSIAEQTHPEVGDTSFKPSTGRGGSPKVLGQKYIDGELRIIYDAEELKRYKAENGLKEDSSPETAQDDHFPLLPVSNDVGGAYEQHNTLSSHGMCFALPMSPPGQHLSQGLHYAQPVSSPHLVEIPVPFRPTSDMNRFSRSQLPHRDSYAPPRNAQQGPNPFPHDVPRTRLKQRRHGGDGSGRYQRPSMTATSTTTRQLSQAASVHDIKGEEEEISW